MTKIQSKKGLVSIIIVNYLGKDYLPKLFASIREQDYQNYEIVFVDNTPSDEDMKMVKRIEKVFPKKIKLIKPGGNIGFAAGNNLALRVAEGEYLLFLNNDAFLGKDALNEMVKLISKDFFCAGVAPKIYLSKFLPVRIFDSIGTCMDRNGSPYNRGIGQVDLGQYDQEEEIFGLCYAAALVKKEIYSKVGSLDNSYFAYFEDVDWSFRARKMGFRFFSCPKAEVYHSHSASSSKKSYQWKYYLIFRNYLRTTLKDFGKRNALRVLRLRTKSLLGMVMNHKDTSGLRWAAMKVLISFYCRDIFSYSLKRFIARKDFINDIVDEQLFSFAIFEPSEFFNPITYNPNIRLQLLKFIFYRLNYIRPNSFLMRDWDRIERAFYYFHDKWGGILAKYVNTYTPRYYNQETIDFITKNLKEF